MEFVGGTPALQVLLVAVIFLSVLMEVKTGGLGVGVLLGIVADGASVYQNNVCTFALFNPLKTRTL